MHDDKNELLSKIESQKLQISFLEETLKNLGHSNDIQKTFLIRTMPKNNQIHL